MGAEQWSKVTKTESPLVLQGVRRDDAHTHTQKARPLDSELEWNVKLVTDLLEFFGPYIELSTKNSLKDDVNRKKVDLYC